MAKIRTVMRIRTPHILRRYVVASFLKTFSGGLAGFLAIRIFAHFLEKMNLFLGRETPVMVIAEYLALQIPAFLVEVLPISILLAALFTLGALSRYNELTAMVTAGIRPVKILAPILWFGFAMSVLSFGINEFLIPPIGLRSNYVYYQLIRGRTGNEYLHQTNVIYRGSNATDFMIGELDGEKGIATRFMVNQFNHNGTLICQVYAATATWNGSSWVLYNGVERRFRADKGNIFWEIGFRKRYSRYTITPPELASPAVTPLTMNIWELSKWIQKTQARGMSVRKELVRFHIKIASPLSCLIILLIGIPFGWNWGKSGKMMGFAISLFIAFGYWGAIEAGRIMGEQGMLSPLPAAWFANVVFGVLAIYLMGKQQVK